MSKPSQCGWPSRREAQQGRAQGSAGSNSSHLLHDAVKGGEAYDWHQGVRFSCLRRSRLELSEVLSGGRGVFMTSLGRCWFSRSVSGRLFLLLSRGPGA